MDFDDFLGRVQDRAQLESTGHALQVTRITLDTLGERIQPGEATDLAAQLPAEIDRLVTAVSPAENFDFERFVDRLVSRGGYDPDDRADAVFHAQVVLDVVGEAVSGGELDDLRAQLPDGEGWAELFAVADQEASVSPSE
ncbi:MAG: DUF2267 domain-containing protein [Haloarculaceae archaeon]